MLTRGIVVSTVAAVMLSGSAAYADARADARAQVEFGMAVAQKGLWHEAIYRWERAIQIDPTYAAAHNNLAVAYEQAGMLDKAKEAYEKALAFEPKNDVIRQNYEQFKEIHERSNHSQRE
jgi:Tfp pilus assembly protein PilF